MSTRPSLNPYAEAEYEIAFTWYRERDVHAANRFATAFDRAVEMIAALPEVGAPCDERCRYWPVRKFPYGLVYLYDGTTVRIVAVPHDRQKPGYWAERG